MPDWLLVTALAIAWVNAGWVVTARAGQTTTRDKHGCPTLGGGDRSGSHNRYDWLPMTITWPVLLAACLIGYPGTGDVAQPPDDHRSD